MTRLTPTRLIFCLLVGSLVIADWEFLLSQSPDSRSSLVMGPAKRSVLVKKTDRVISGNVRTLGNHTEIEIADQSRVSLLQDQIAYIGDDLEAVYQFKRKSVARWAVGDHFQLSRWCIQNGLLDHAVEHFWEVNRQASQNEAVKRLGAELEQKVLADVKFRQYIGLPPINAVATIAPVNAQKSNEVITASFTNSDGNHGEIALRFTDRIQPILINRCSQAACHGVSSTSAFRIIEPSGKSYARISSENLRQVLAQLERDQTGIPKLLRFATEPHGLQREPGLTAVEVGLLDELKRWTKFVENPVIHAVGTLGSQATNGEVLASGNQPLQPASLNALTPVPPGTLPLRSVPRSTDAHEFPAGETRPLMSEIDALEMQLNHILSTQPSVGGSSSGDPFDPAEFNRQVGRASQR